MQHSGGGLRKKSAKCHCWVLNMPALITQGRLRAHRDISRWEEQVRVWHVNSNHDSDIHQAPRPTVGIHPRREDLQALFFCFTGSICRCLSHFFSLRSLSLSSRFVPFIHLPFALVSHTLSSCLSVEMRFLLLPVIKL